MSSNKMDKAWKNLFIKYNIKNEIDNHGFYNIMAKDIKEFEEPRLMAKWDTSASLPTILNDNEINILPTSRKSYILGKFKLYEDIPQSTLPFNEIQKVSLPHFESLNIDDITSEACSINVMLISNILEDFLNEEGLVRTFDGRMLTGKFNFHVDVVPNGQHEVCVDNAQCEIDLGLESSKSIVIVEAKTILCTDFHIRQLYYPYRLWKTKVKKPIRLVFAIYSNQIFRLFEYEFTDDKNYSSIRLIRKKYYSFQDTYIENEDLYNVYQETKVRTCDNIDNDDVDVPFIQANSFDKVISLLEILQKESQTPESIANIMQFNERQSDYYFNAGKYLGLFKKETSDIDGNKSMQITLTTLGRKVVRMKYKERQLKLVQLILEHQIFYDFFPVIYNTGNFPDLDTIQNKMREYNVMDCSDNTLERRSRSVLKWLEWIFTLP